VILAGLLIELIIFFMLEKTLGKPFKTNHKYAFGKYASLMSIPIYGLIALIISGDFGYVQLFFFGAIVGTTSEYLAGRYFHKITGQRIWTYKYLSIQGYTSIFTLPYWGGATIFFVGLAKLLQ